ncbi:MAG: rRNA maturation RNase YbeY [Lachnospiraceae bacterium]|jgi:probable rRNA maturation factor|nr:rRNA maturation RNase YbeY [Lachnospiraceae bacterium]
MNGKIQIIYDSVAQKTEYDEVINRVIENCYKTEKIDNKNIVISITLTTPEKIQKLNSEYRNINNPTDVLSFPMYEKGEIYSVSSGNETLLGDIVISIEKVKEQALEYGTGFEREFSYMLAHGFYHLMGYDHENDTEKSEMRQKEETVLNLV